MIEHSMSILEAQEALSRLPEQFVEDSDPVIVTQDGKPVMVILPFSDYERIAAIDAALETLEILEDEETMAAIRQGEQELAEGKGIPWEDVKRELGLDGDE